MPERHGQRISPDYDTVPYAGVPVPGSAPSSLTLCSMVNGGPTPAIRGSRVGELGCGDGGNLLPLAFYHPDSTFVGIDSSPGQIRRARAAAECVGTPNVEFVVGDVRDLVSADSVEPAFDYIIAHGLYSWVPEDVRVAILAFCRRRLAASGLAFISYNTQPGWATRRLVREVLLRTPAVWDAPVTEQAARAIDVAARLLEDLPSREYAFPVVLAEELQRVCQAKPFYVAHEYLAEINEGFWLGDFVDDAQRRGLRYVADAQFCRPRGQVPASLKAALAARGLEPIAEEEAADLLGHRYFRESVLCRDDAPRDAVPRPLPIERVWIASRLASKSDPFAMQDGVVEAFLGADGAEVTVDTSITKAALVVLAVRWPRAERLDAIFDLAATLLVEHGFPVRADARAILASEVTTLFQAGQIEWRLYEPSGPSAAAPLPRAHALARHQASLGLPLTTPFHSPVEFAPDSLALIAALDGAHTPAQLSAMFGDEVVGEVLPLAVRWGLLDGTRIERYANGDRDRFERRQETRSANGDQ